MRPNKIKNIFWSSSWSLLPSMKLTINITKLLVVITLFVNNIVYFCDKNEHDRRYVIIYGTQQVCL